MNVVKNIVGRYASLFSHVIFYIIWQIIKFINAQTFQLILKGYNSI